MAMRILLSGASGMIGTALHMRLRDMGHDVRLLVRRPPAHDREVRWDPATDTVPSEQIEWADAVVSLSGSSLTRLPWTPGYRSTIRSSRVDTTHTMATAIAEATNPPRVWANASAVGYYGRGPRLDPFDESSPKGSGFLADIVEMWEAATAPAADRTRVVHLRTGVVIGPMGALTPLALATKFGCGPTFASGAQRWPWVSLFDEARAIEHVLSADVAGPVNIAAPVLDTQSEVVDAVARRLHRPNWLRIPAPLLRVMLGTAANDMLLSDQPVAPNVLLDSGFEFSIDQIDEAVAVALGLKWKPPQSYSD
ncbi:TIGR01777 family oxidoreductase [Paramicrobacterium chengjingii]|uniref:TIGR01777 family oxidoreductase n=1 Tax=Paramicrobacterium chengjingii TaxID=2769067 RepID=A0ABX6YFX0_9MICO|nr:TIGR01777 family oxidoreductase [Microbacterium chengjingii]QPZ37504.1 TIGR01777 family oxidoreductase [Microbacterium chengjingii]